ncbi:unnamed protein product, partial [Mesorhabditis spiculigera]
MGDYGYGGGGGGGGGPPGYGGGGGGGGGYGAGYGGEDPYAMMPQQSPLDAEIQVVIGEIDNELTLLEQSGDYGAQFRNAKRLLMTESDRLRNCIDPEWLEVDVPKTIKVTKKVLIPNFRHPHFNFVGKIIGPKGQTLQQLAKDSKCHILVLGRGSTKDRQKERELLESGDPTFAHYGGPLHVKIETIAPAHVAYTRVAGVLEKLQDLLQPIRGDNYPGESDKEKDGEAAEEAEYGWQQQSGRSWRWMGAAWRSRWRRTDARTRQGRWRTWLSSVLIFTMSAPLPSNTLAKYPLHHSRFIRLPDV